MRVRVVCTAAGGLSIDTLAGRQVLTNGQDGEIILDPATELNLLDPLIAAGKLSLYPTTPTTPTTTTPTTTSTPTTTTSTHT